MSAQSAWRLGVLTLLVLMAAVAVSPATAADPKGESSRMGSEAPSPPPPPRDPSAEPPAESTAPDAPEELRRFHRNRPDKVVFGNDYELPAGAEHDGNVVCFAGNVKIAGTVHGDVVVFGGNLDLSGEVRGDTVGIGSKLTLGDRAKVGGDLVNVVGRLQNDGADVQGQIVNLGIGTWIGRFSNPLGFFGFVLFWVAFLKLVLVFIGLLLLAVFVPDRIRVVADEVPLRPFLAFFAGLGGYLLLVIVLVLFCITIIGIPAAILLYFAFVVLKWLGLAGIFLTTGRRIGRMLGREMSLLGALLLGFLPFAVLRFLPFCIGGVLWTILEVIGVGLVILTRAGGRPYRPAGAFATHGVPPVPRAEPMPIVPPAGQGPASPGVD